MKKQQTGNRILAIILSMLMVLSNTLPAFADVIGSNEVMKKAILKDGESVNLALKALSGNVVEEDAEASDITDTSVKKILYTSVAPSEDKTKVDISSNDIPVYAWFEPITEFPTTGAESVDEIVEDMEDDSIIGHTEESVELTDNHTETEEGQESLLIESVSGYDRPGCIYLYSPADTIYYGTDASSMFEGFAELSDISGLISINFSEVENADYMFRNATILEDITPVRSYRGDALKSAFGVFTGTHVAEEDIPLWYKEANTVNSDEADLQVESDSTSVQETTSSETSVESENVLAQSEPESIVEEEEEVPSEGFVSGDHTSDNIALEQEENKSEQEQSEEQNELTESVAEIPSDETHGIVSGDYTGKIGIVSGDHTVKENQEEISEETESEIELVEEVIDEQEEDDDDEYESGVYEKEMTDSFAEAVLKDTAEINNTESNVEPVVEEENHEEPVYGVNMELDIDETKKAEEEKEPEVSKNGLTPEEQDAFSREANQKIHDALKYEDGTYVDLTWMPDIEVTSEELLNYVAEDSVFPKTAKPTSLTKSGYTYEQYYGDTLTRAYVLIDSDGRHTSICLAPPLNSPGDGTYGSGKIYEVNNKLLLKALYYGYGGPGHSLTGVSLATTHVAAAKLYGKYQWDYAAGSRTVSNAKAFISKLYTLPDPPYGTVGYILAVGNGTQHLAYVTQLQKGIVTIKKTADKEHITEIPEYDLKTTFTIVDSQGVVVVEEITTGPTSGLSAGVSLPEGSYKLKETKKPSGAKAAVGDIGFVIGADGQSQTIDVENEFYPYTELYLEKRDSVTGKKIAQNKLRSASFRIQEAKSASNHDANNDNHWKNYCSMTYGSNSDVFYSNERLFASNTNGGWFRIVETSAPNNYSISKPISFNINDAKYDKKIKKFLKTVVMYDEPEPKNIYLVKVDENGNKIRTQGKFGVYQWSKRRGKYIKLGLMVQSTQNYNYHFNDLHITKDNGGKFLVKEEESPEGYTGSFIEKIQLGVDDPNLTFQKSNRKIRLYGNIHLTKKSTDGTILGDGFTFKVYEWNGSKYSKLVDTLKYNATNKRYESNKNKLEITSQNRGKFKVIETKGKQGFVFKNDPLKSVEVTLSETDKTINISMTNTPNEYKIKKVGPRNELVNAEFVIKASKTTVSPIKLKVNGTEKTFNNTKTLTAQTINGIIELTEIPDGEYTLVEHRVLSSGNYIVSTKTYKFTVSKGKVSDDNERNKTSATITIINDSGTPLTIQKVSSPDSTIKENGFPKGTEFKIEEWSQKENKYIETPPYATAVYDETSQKFVSKDTGAEIGLVIKSDNQGKFKVTETAATPGYIIDTEPQEIVVNTTDTSKTVTFSNIPNDYTIEKVSPTGTPMKARFKFTYVGSQSSVKVKANNTVYTISSSGTNIDTDNDGKIKFVALPTGTYNFTEVKSNETNADNVIIDTKTYSIRVYKNGTIKGDTVKQIVNKYGAKLTITKVSSDTSIIKNNFPAGTEFALEEMNVNTEEWETVCKLIYDASNNTFIDTRTDAKPVLAYSSKNEGQYRVRETKSTPGYVLDTTPVVIEPVPQTFTTELSRTAEFTNKPNHFEILKTDIDGNPIKDVTFRIKNTNNASEDYVLTTDDSGIVSIDCLTPGAWTYQETSAPAPYKLDETIYPFTVLDNGKIMDTNGELLERAEVTVKNSESTRVIIKKYDAQTGMQTDSETGFPKGTVFAIYEWDKTNEKYGTVPIKYVTYATDEEIAAGNVSVSDITKEYAGEIDYPLTGSIQYPRTDFVTECPNLILQAITDNTSDGSVKIYVKIKEGVANTTTRKHLWCYLEPLDGTGEDDEHIDKTIAAHYEYQGADKVTFQDRKYDAVFTFKNIDKTKAVSYWVYASNSSTKPTSSVSEYGATMGSGFTHYNVTLKAEDATPASQTVKLYIGSTPTRSGAKTPTKTGYTFKNWKRITGPPTDGANMGDNSWYGYVGNYWDSSKPTVLTRNYNQTQRWDAVFTANTYKVAFKGNGATSGTMSNQSFTYNVAETLTANQFKRTGYRFTGWNTKADGSGTSYNNKANVMNLTSTNGGTVNLYAIWAENTYKIAFDANGASGTAPSAITNVKYTAIKTLPGVGSMTRTGYTFLGWSTNKNATQKQYSGGEKVSKLTSTNNATVTLYAVWAKNKYTVKFNGNGATSGSMSNQSFTYDVAQTLTANKFKRTGYTFLGWSKSATATTQTYTNQQSVKNLTSTANATVNLYAIWKPIQYNIRFDGNGSTGGSTSPMNGIKYGETRELTANGYTKTGKYFAGWSRTQNGAVQYANKEKISNLTTTNNATITLYAIWKDNPVQYKTLKMRFWARGFTQNEGNNPEKTWFRIDSSSDKSVERGTPSEEIYNNHRLGTTSYTRRVVVGDTVTIDNSWLMECPNGYEIYPDCYVDLVGTIKINTLPQPATVLAGGSDVTAYFYYRPIWYKISYNLGADESIVGTKPNRYNVNYGATLPTATKDGYEFLGWRDQYGKVYEPGGDGVNQGDEAFYRNDDFQNGEDFYTRMAQRQTGDVYLTPIWSLKGNFVDPETCEPPELLKTENNLGKFLIREVEATEGYILDEQEQQFTFDNAVDGIINLTFNNTPNEVKLRKVDKNGNPLQPQILDDNTSKSVEITITDPEGNATAYRPGPDGYITLSRLKSGIWTYQETYAPNGYVLDNHIYTFEVDARTHEVKSGPDDITMVNTDSSTYLIKKVDADGKAMSGIIFDVTDTSGSTASYTTDSNGYIYIDIINNATGTYKFKERTSQPNYQPGTIVIDTTEYTFQVSAGKVVGDVNQKTVVNNYNKFKLIKTTEDGTPINGATFRIWNDQSVVDEGVEPPDDAFDKKIVTGSVEAGGKNGKINLESLVAGNWHWQEIEGPDGFIASDEEIHDFTVFENGNIGENNTYEYTVTAVNKKLKLKLIKKDENGNLLKGVTFHIWNTITGSKHLDGQYTTDVNGEINISNIAYGTYYYTETSTVPGYVLDKRVQTITLSSETVDTNPYVIEAVNAPNEFELIKINKETGETITGETTFKFTFNPLVAGTTSSVTNNASYTTTEGKISFTKLAPGTYTFQETKAPVAYKLDDTVHTFTVAADGTIHSDDRIFDIETDATSCKASVKVENENVQQIIITIKKTDENNNNLTGCEFEVFKVTIPEGGNLENATLTPFSPANKSAYDSTTQTYTFTPIEVENSEDVYCVMETAGKSGYVKNFKEFITPAEAMEEDNELTFEAVNTKNSIDITKLDADGNVVTKALSFLIWKGNETKTSYAATDGVVTLSGLSAGTWHYSEDPEHVPEGFLPDTDINGEMNVYDFTVDADGYIIGLDGTKTTNAHFTVVDELDKRVPLKVRKLDEDGNVLTGVEFKAYPYSKTTEQYLEDSTHEINFIYDTAESVYKTTNDLKITTENEGKFLIKETKAPEGIVADWSEEVMLSDDDVLSGDPVELVATNRKNEVTLIKLDTEGEEVTEEVGFLVWKGNEAKQSYITDNGSVTLTGLSAGTWHFSEDPDHVPEGFLPDTDSNGQMKVYDFVINDKGQIVLPSGEVTDEASFSITDKRNITFNVAINKQNETGELMTNAVFEAYPYEANAVPPKYLDDDEHVIHFIYDDDEESVTYKKYVNVEQMEYTPNNQGQYLIKEIEAGDDGYVADWQQVLKVDISTIEDNHYFEYNAVNYPNQLKVKKVDNEGNTLNGVHFNLYEIMEDGYENGTEFYSEDRVTQGQGIATWEKIPAGEYMLVETMGLEGYKKSDEEMHIVVNESGMIYLNGQEVNANRVLEVEYENPKNSLTILKLDSTTKQPIQNVGFIIERLESDDNKLIGNNTIETATKLESHTGRTGADGKYNLTGLTDGLWYFKETSVPSPYTLCEEPRLFFVVNGGIKLNYEDDTQSEVEFKIYNGRPVEGNVKVRKIDADTGEVLRGVEFGVWPKDTKIEGYKTDTTDPIMTLVYRDGYYVNPSPLIATEENQGYFLIKETKAPDGYAGIEEKIINIFESTENEVTMTNHKINLIIEKYDTEHILMDEEPFEYKTINGATFKFWEDGHESEARTFVTGAEVDGQIIIGSLKSDTLYHFQETIPPVGYVQNDEIYDVIVGKDGQINMNHEDCIMRVPNTPTKSIKGQIHLHTGGTGRTVLYVVGGVMAVALLGVVALRKKKKKEEELAE